jgi:hypothetical protein
MDGISAVSIGFKFGSFGGAEKIGPGLARFKQQEMLPEIQKAR